MKPRFLTAACAAALVCVSGGCTEDYPPFARLEALRVLAIQSEPVAPAVGETTILTPLVYAQPGKVVSYAWSWCPLPGPANQGYPCMVSEAQLAGFLPPGSVPSYDLGSEPTANFPLNFDPELLRPLCRRGMDAGGPPSPDAAAPGGVAIPAIVDCENGFPVQIKLIVTTDNDRVESVRTMNLRMDLSVPVNQNPRISGLAATLKVDEKDEKSPTYEVTFDEMGSVILPRQRATPIRAIVSLDQAEPLPVQKPEDPPKERLYLTWLVESGSTSPEKTSVLATEPSFERFSRSEWKPASPLTYPNPTARLFVILRDDRGGVSWTWGLATLVEVPQ